jgi:alpha-beta hydrolase superfamily lysophospholipase
MTALPLIRTFEDAQGVEVTFFEWPVTSPKAIVQIAHGLGEHARRYDHVAEALNRAGYSVYADDHRGHGQTGLSMRAKGTIKKQGNLGPGGMKATFAAVHKLTGVIRAENPGKPVVLIGHSWGSMIAQRILNPHSADYAAAVLTGSTLLVPGIMPSAGFNKKWAAEAAGPDGSGAEWLSRDIEVGKKFRNDPLNFPETAMQVFGAANSAQILGLPSRKLKASLPILLQAGSDDAIGGERGNKLLLNALKRAGIQDLELIVYHGARHEVFNETNKEEVLADLVGWLDARFK